MADTRPAFGPHYGFGLYVHWPYCSKICPYCDFNVYAAKDRDASQLTDALLADLLAHRQGLPEHGKLDTIFFGGGTPSLMPAADIARVTAGARDLFGLADDAEISLEANPNDLIRGDLRGWRAAGVNRLSLGVQSLDDGALALLGRDHDSAIAVKAVKMGLAHFPSVSIDVIYARPGQTAASWEAELKQAIGLGVHHMSLYELTIEPQTAFGKAVERGEMIPVGEEAQAMLYEVTEAVMNEAGLPAYEVSNYARGAQHRSRHNSIYWNSGDWMGIGPGAHGRLSIGGGRLATEAEKRPDKYIDQVEKGSPGWAEAQTLSSLDVAREMTSMGLRPSEGIETARIEALTGQPVDLQKVSVFGQEGWMSYTDGRIALTAAGRLLADALAVEIAP